MSRLNWTRSFCGLVFAVLARGASLGAQTFRVVNMIPAEMAGEHTQNSEPTLAVSSATPKFLVASAFTSGLHMCKGRRSAPLFVSTNDGDTWRLACILPMDSSRFPEDLTVRISGDGKALYVGMLDVHTVRSGKDSGQRRMDASVLGWTAAGSTVDHLFKTTARATPLYWRARCRSFSERTRTSRRFAPRRPADGRCSSSCRTGTRF